MDVHVQERGKPRQRYYVVATANSVPERRTDANNSPAAPSVLADVPLPRADVTSLLQSLLARRLLGA